jgi:hypothetical protein
VKEVVYDSRWRGSLLADALWKGGSGGGGGKGGDILAHDRVRRPSPLFGRFTPFAVDVFCSQGWNPRIPFPIDTAPVDTSGLTDTAMVLDLISYRSNVSLLKGNKTVPILSKLVWSPATFFNKRNFFLSIADIFVFNGTEKNYL